MGLLQDISDAIGGDKLKQLANGQGNFDTHESSDQSAVQDLIRRIDPGALKKIFGHSAQGVDPQEYSDHVTPGVNNTDPLGQLKGGALASIAAVLLNSLKQAGSHAAGQPGNIPGLQNVEPEDMTSNDVAAVARYAQQNHPDAFGNAVAQIGQQQPGLLHNLLGKSAMALAAAALASHFIKLDRKAPK